MCIHMYKSSLFFPVRVPQVFSSAKVRQVTVPELKRALGDK